MAIHKIKLHAVVILIMSTFIFSTCKKAGLGCANTVYNFQLLASVFPDKDSIHIGDTIWLEANSTTMFRDINSNVLVDYSDAVNLGSAIGFGEYSIINNPIFAANSFKDILITGSNVNNPNVVQIREYLFSEKNNMYVFKLGIVPQQSGIFGIGFSNANNVYRKSDKCTKANFQIILENTRHHYYLNPNINRSNFDTTKPNGSYYFKVN